MIFKIKNKPGSHQSGLRQEERDLLVRSHEGKTKFQSRMLDGYHACCISQITILSPVLVQQYNICGSYGRLTSYTHYPASVTQDLHIFGQITCLFSDLSFFLCEMVIRPTICVTMRIKCHIACKGFSIMLGIWKAPNIKQ